MNWAQFKDPVSTCVLLVSHIRGGWVSPFTMTNIFVTEFSENIKEKLKCFPRMAIEISELPCINYLVILR